MDNTVKIGCIKYLNSLPLFHDLSGEKFADGLNGRSEGVKFDVIYETPSTLNRMMSEGALDIAAISSFHYLQNRDDFQMMNKFCISAVDRVMSVFIVSRSPLSDLSNRTIYLSDESATSSALARILASEFFDNPGVKFTTVKVTASTLEEMLERDPGCGVMLIGDEALKYYEYYRKNGRETAGHKIYDLCEVWNRFTALPFIFAIVAIKKDFYFQNRPLCDIVSREIADRLKFFRENRGLLIKKAAEISGLSETLLDEYYGCLNYEFVPEHLMSLEEFEKRLKKISAVSAVK